MAMEIHEFKERQERIVAKRLILAYLRNVKVHLSENATRPANEYVMRGLEESANISESACLDFRQSLIRPIINKVEDIRDIQLEDLPINLEKAVKRMAFSYIWVQTNLLEH
jgi:hypothetical protein